MENVLIGFFLSQLILLPLALKWELELKPVIISGALVGLVAGLAMSLIQSFFTLGMLSKLILDSAFIVCISILILLVRFYRDPERVPPSGGNIIVAPADGIIKYIKRIEPGNIPHSCKGKETAGLSSGFIGILPEQKGFLVGIAMDFLNVHVTRAPLDGTMIHSEHVDGSFYSLKRTDALYKNERVNQIIHNARLNIGLIHIASRLVRRIVPYVHEGEDVILGQRLGIIKFGSQVDVILPDLTGMEVRIRTGEKVTAGETIIAIY